MTLTSWLPAPVTVETLDFLVEPGTYRHLAWSAVAGVGIGLLFRIRRPARILGLVPLLLAGADHAAHNFDVNLLADSGFGEAITAPFIAAKPVLWLWPLLALAGAMAWDLVVFRRALTGHPRLRLAGERDADPLNRIIALPRYAVLKMPWTMVLVIRFVRMRRAALYGTICPEQAEPALDRVADVREQLDASSMAAAWRGVGRMSVAGTERTGGWWRRYWPVVVWALLFVPPFVYFVIGSTPGLNGAQELLGAPAVFAAVAVLALVGAAWVGWCLVRAALALPAAARSPEGVVLAQIEMRIVIAFGALLLAAVAIMAWLGGAGADDPLISNVHVLDALSDALLVLGVALLIGAFIYFPPAALVTAAGVGTVLIPTVTGGFVAMGTLGVSSIMLSQAVDAGAPSGGSGGSGSGQGVPPKPPRPKPQVRHWRLRRIVDDLWHGANRSGRVGDGTTMDAVRNEILTGQPTRGVFHTNKARQYVRALDRWIRDYGPQASRADRQWAWQLKRELESVLGMG